MGAAVVILWYRGLFFFLSYHCYNLQLQATQDIFPTSFMVPINLQNAKWVNVHWSFHH